ncbi:hypothetical protein ACFO1B_43935 [Dactylosporangium siamense]|uniref:Uncharacterized protein n=1 Tax=Dactylosporangium siamense TaxID=685454 RepID=A0A919Q0U3_9ACTN|nr:hypothetical protein [Dactylosporangium siamense]GIG53207.1 hypothetical protein Dsi01nite_112480 [Dactylosporangium siamense]
MDGTAPPEAGTWFFVGRVELDTATKPGTQMSLAHQVGKHLAELFNFRPETIVGRRTDLGPDGVPERVEVEYHVSGHRVTVTSVPNRIDPGMRDYTLAVGGEPVPYLATLWRPAAELIAEAAFTSIRAAMHRPRHHRPAPH